MDDAHKPKDPEATEGWEPLPGVPIYDRGAFQTAGEADSLAGIQLTIERLFRFVYGNLGHDRGEVLKNAAYILTNIPAMPDKPLWLAAAIFYYTGVFDGVRIQLRQAELDAQRTVQ